MSEMLLIEDVDTELLDKQRLQLSAALFDPEVREALGEKRAEALDGLLNMLDSWSDKRAEFFEPPVDWQPAETVLGVIKHEDWTWARNMRCKYIVMHVDTRDGRCLIRDRNQLRISLDDLRKQYTGEKS